MPSFSAQNLSTYYEFEHLPNRPVVVFSNSLGADLHMWEPQVAALREHFSVLRYDTRGHGRSSVPAGPYNVQQLGQDVLNLLDHLDLKRVHFCGLSMGGLVAQWLGVHAPERMDRIVLSNTAARIGTEQSWKERIQSVQQNGINILFPSVLDRWFTADLRASHETEVDAISRALRTTDAAGYAAACAALRDCDLREQVHQISAPVLVIYGEQDAVTTRSDAAFLAAEIKCAEMLGLPAAHLANVEAADAWTDAVVEFLSRSRSDHSTQHQQGLKVRREVLGDAHVDRAQANMTPFNEPFQDFITRYAWGEIWSRPGLPRHTRSLLTLALMVALNREEEFKMHVRAAFNNGVSRKEIQELLLHCAIYCGLPAANSAFQWAADVFATLDLTDSEGKSKLKV